ncbi:hypothetical protein Tco_1102155 [Tanacetum coccineum]
MTRVNMFVDMDTEMKEGSNKAKIDTAQEGNSKRAGNELEQEKAKKQKGDHDQEEEEIKKHMEIVQDDEVAIDVIPLAIKPLMIVEYKIDKEGKMGYFKLIRADRSSKRYSFMIEMLQEEKYPLTPATIIIMINKKLQTDQWNDMCYQLLKLMTKQCKNPGTKQDLFKWDQHITLVSCGYDWSDQAEEGPNYALMAFLSSSPDSETMKVIVGGLLLSGGNPKEGNHGKYDETSGILKSFITGIENLVDHKVKVVTTLSFMRPFGCLVTILNTIDHLGKFDGKAGEGFFIGYSLNSKAFRVFNSRIRIVEENLHIRFSESTPNVVGTQSNGFVGTKASDNATQARKETKHVKDYILLPLWTIQEKKDNVNNTDNVNVVGINKVNAVGGKTSIELPFDPNMPALEDYNIFNLSRDDKDDGLVADMNNLEEFVEEVELVEE